MPRCLNTTTIPDRNGHFHYFKEGSWWEVELQTPYTGTPASSPPQVQVRQPTQEWVVAANVCCGC
jgi:hypothetical protein